jgi:DNA polymerase I-like protein with 3'-5' exonuclease and polymerase domains
MTAFTRNIFTPVIYDIEERGMHIDEERVKPVHRDYHTRLKALRIQIDKITGGANPKSPKQMIEVLYEQLKFKKPADTPQNRRKKWITPAGSPTTSFDYIQTLKPNNKTQKRFLELKKEYGKVSDALSKCLNKFVQCVDETEDHILTATLNQTITATQRLSSTGKNYGAQFQNFPRIFKPLFSAREEGWYMGEIDQAQLEYRVAVWFGQDEVGIYDIEHKVDSHSFTAEHIFGTEFTRLTDKDPQFKKLRTNAKAHTFKPLYGGQSGTANEVRYYKAFKKKHKGITAVQEEWKREACNSQKVQIPSGLWFYYPGTRINASGYVQNTTKICNYPVQSFATADIVPIGVTYQWHLMRLANMKSYLVNTIHDSSIGEVHPDEVDQYAEIGSYAFVNLVYEYLQKVFNVEFNVPLEAEAEFNKNWNDSPDWQEEYLHI